MKQFSSLALILLVTLIWIRNGNTADRAVKGLLIGAGSGAIIGHVAGQTPESVLIGSAVGGAIGYAIGKEQDRPPRVVVHDSYRPVVRHDRTPAWHYDRSRPSFRDDHRRWDRNCRESVSYRKHHGSVTRIVKTVCDRPYHQDWDRYRYRPDRGDDRRWYR